MREETSAYGGNTIDPDSDSDLDEDKPQRPDVHNRPELQDARAGRARTKTWFGSSKQRNLKVPNDVNAGAFLLKTPVKTLFYWGFRWWAQQGSNLRPKDYESSALTD